MGSPAIFKGSNVKLLKDNIEFLSDQEIITGVATDPSSSATDAPAGSILVNTSGNVYVKQDAGSTTNWDLLSTASTPTGISDSGITFINWEESYNSISADVALGQSSWRGTTPGPYPFPMNVQHGDTSFATPDFTKASIANDGKEIDLIVGTYLIEAECWLQNGHTTTVATSMQMRWRNRTDATTEIMGLQLDTKGDEGSENFMRLSGIHSVVTSTKSYQLQAISSRGSGSWLGRVWVGTAKPDTEDMVFGTIKITKLT